MQPPSGDEDEGDGEDEEEEEEDAPIAFDGLDDDDSDDAAPTGLASIRQQLVEFYQQRFPDRVSKVDGVMSKFAGREHEITKMIQDTVAKERAKGITRPAPAPASGDMLGIFDCAPTAGSSSGTASIRQQVYS
jgi:hypothetical protein